MKTLEIRSNLCSNFQLLFRIRQNEVFVANLPLFTTSQLVKQIFSNFGKVTNIKVKELNKQERVSFTCGEARCSRVCTFNMDVEGVKKLNANEDFVVVHDLQQFCFLNQYNELFQQQQVPSEFINIFEKMLDEQEKPTKVDGWTLNLGVSTGESQRVKKAKLNEFKVNFYKQVEGIRGATADKIKFFEHEAKNGIYDVV